ncbi:hypothetical protein HU200_020714 [Digitaria exilis]|uniref:Uncharacterized protein n=1 Tax=Digitaria exilis TaxID=1010633 RepID=A0A835KEW5_9POAL|nr:hypothetical protein HU200_020714 [Digitaria exilis]
MPAKSRFIAFGNFHTSVASILVTQSSLLASTPSSLVAIGVRSSSGASYIYIRCAI